MNKKLQIGLFLLFFICKVQATDSTFKPQIPLKEADKKAQILLNKMTLEEKLQLISGHNIFYIKGFEKLGIPQLYMADATGGIHLRKEQNQDLDKSVAFPAPVALAATWNKTLAYDMAQAIGEECRVGNVAVLLGPGMNIYRMSQNGRNFEYFGEDPFLAARIVENYVVGLQNTGTMATLKHFVCNNNEHHRRLTNAIVDERALHEIYTPAFKAGIDAGAMAVMTSYNMVNGEYAGQSPEIVNKLLRQKLGFKGLVMSDWWSVYDARKVVSSGLDLEMPGDAYGWIDTLTTPYVYLRKKLPELIKSKQVDVKDVDRMAKSILRTSISMGFYNRPIQDKSFASNFEKHESVALEIARQSVTLLKNETNILPLGAMKGKKILLTGANASEYVYGHGAAEVEGYDQRTLLDAMIQVFGSSVSYRSKASDNELKNANVIVYNTGVFETESTDRPFEMPEEIVKDILQKATINPNIVVVINAGGGVKMSPWINAVKGLIYAYYPGQNGNIAVAEILKGDVNPSGKLPFTIEKKFEDSPAFGYMPANETFYKQWSQDNDFTFPKYDINYKESIFVGYRWYEKKKIEPQFPFGFGLSYTSFEYSKLVLASSFKKGEPLKVTFTVTNTGKKDGFETVQLYVQDVVSSLERPLKELKAFEKVFLKAGTSQQIVLTLQQPDFSFYSPQKSAWINESGEFILHIGSSSADIRLKGDTTQK